LSTAHFAGQTRQCSLTPAAGSAVGQSIELLDRGQLLWGSLSRVALSSIMGTPSGTTFESAH